MQLQANGLILKEINSRVETFSFKNGLKDFISEHFKEDGLIVTYLDYAVLLGYFREGKWLFYNNSDIEERYLQRLRLFNNKKELYIYRTPEGFRARLRVDEEGERTYVVDAEQLLWGTRAEKLGDFTKLTEDRGTTLIVPMKDISVDKKKKRLFLKTRNYIGYTPFHQATYIDCRFIEFENK
ncbi:MAG: CRISPR-associated protein Csx19 [Thermodesulfovibrionales bacterium]